PVKADSGTIRADFAMTMEFNLVHGSDSPESAEQEVALFFSADELVEWDRAVDRWIHD
ncbi:MAG TPA: nucleoside-diphosphate kinase, partial [Chloroflexi bacterium]|nr:nucleoside-diphosphate kinase [Chloroflexota bacterium]